MEYVWHMHGIWNMLGVCMETLVSVNPLAQNPSSLLPPSHEITSSLQHSGPKTEPRKILEQLCFLCFFLSGSIRGLHQTLAGHIPPLTTIIVVTVCR